MASSLRSDGKAVEVVLAADVLKGRPVVAEGFHGIAMENGVTGETIAIEIALREHEVEVPAGVTAAKGDTLYVTDAGVITTTATGNSPFLKVTLAKDANNIVWGVLLPQA